MELLRGHDRNAVLARKIEITVGIYLAAQADLQRIHLQSAPPLPRTSPACRASAGCRSSLPTCHHARLIAQTLRVQIACESLAGWARGWSDRRPRKQFGRPRARLLPAAPQSSGKYLQLKAG